MNPIERIARLASRFGVAADRTPEHPFEARDIHEKLPLVVRQLFDDSHYAQATFEAFKFLDNEVQRHSKTQMSGTELMMKAFREQGPLIQLTPLVTPTEKGEQEGYKFLFAGSILAIRNLRGHTHSVQDDAGDMLGASDTGVTLAPAT